MSVNSFHLLCRSRAAPLDQLVSFVFNETVSEVRHGK